MGLCHFDPQFCVMCRQECDIRFGQENRLEQVHEDEVILNIKDRALGIRPSFGHLKISAGVSNPSWDTLVYLLDAPG